MQHLRNGGNIGVLIDLQVGPKHPSVPVRSFGRLSAVTRLHTMLQKRMGYPIIPIESVPLPDGRYRTIAHDPIHFPPEVTEREIAQKCWDFFEGADPAAAGGVAVVLPPLALQRGRCKPPFTPCEKNRSTSWWPRCRATRIDSGPGNGLVQAVHAAWRVWLAAGLFLTACSSGPRDFTGEYHQALEERPGVTLENWLAGRRAVSGFADLYGDLSPDRVKAKTKQVYAPDAWFNDTIATEVGVDAIEGYLLKTAEGTEVVRAKVQDVAVSGADCYVRWTMEVRTKNLADGQTVTTDGMTHLRFDEGGRIVLHQDFWNPAAGIYQQLPFLGPAIRFVNGGSPNLSRVCRQKGRKTFNRKNRQYLDASHSLKTEYTEAMPRFCLGPLAWAKKRLNIRGFLRVVTP